MKKLIACTLVLALTVFATTLQAQSEPVGVNLNSLGIKLALLKKDGTPLLPAEVGNQNMNEQKGQLTWNNNVIQWERTSDSDKATTFKLKSALLKDGTLAIGWSFPNERHQVKFKADKNKIAFANRQKTTASWTGAATFVAPQDRESLSIEFAEYGAADRWKDVTDLVKKQVVCDAANFQANNKLFTDPAPGQVKTLVLTYSLGDDERIENMNENAWIRIQFDPKDQFYRLQIKDTDSFELNFNKP